MSRRKFLKNLGALGAGTVLTPLAAKLHSPSLLSPKKNHPIVISTWIHGMAANAGAWEILGTSGDALDAVQKGVAVTESDLTNRSVGLGGRPDRDGYVTLDACIMDHDSRCGSVAFLEDIQHPIDVARAIMDKTQHVMLVGEGAQKWALENGFPKVDYEVPFEEVQKEYEEWLIKSEYETDVNVENHDTIGMLAMDANGRIAGACTTSGMAYKIRGRVGDSPIIGAGLFIDGDVGGATATGVGEAIIRTAGASAVVESMRRGASPEEACYDIVQRLLKKHRGVEGMQVGFLAMNMQGEYGGYSVYNGFNYALRTQDRNEMVDSKYTRTWD
ncbi:MAG TPA: glycosylasparaginase [Cryomorphaceae bacterium]|nr:glycosylasparaginase [Cryomorphaceae bacterium]|tara:strand:- start:675 stop:1664 length:990 start_codon:yes stop_codon:yes gene_type:complete